ncbi:MAG: AAA family ATPase [Methylococcales bacterium]|nr:AAA family ATPase [Methylococcales bacterium]
MLVDITLNETQVAELTKLQLEAMEAAKPESDQLKQQYTQKEFTKLVEQGVPEPDALKIINSRLHGYLPSSHRLFGKSCGSITVQEMMDNPEAYVNERFFDPMDENSTNYRAILLRCPKSAADPTLVYKIRSFAHGGTFYRLEYFSPEDKIKLAQIDVWVAREIEKIIANTRETDDEDTLKTDSTENLYSTAEAYSNEDEDSNAEANTTENVDYSKEEAEQDTQGQSDSSEQSILEETHLVFACADDMAVKATAPKFLIEDILNEDASGILGGCSQSFKSFTALGMAHSICSGKPFMGKQVYETGPVVYICGEGEGAIARRFKGLVIEHGGFNNNFIILKTSISIDNTTDMAALKIELRKIKPKFVIIDTFASLISTTEENSTSAVGAVLRAVKETCRNADGSRSTSSMIVHHFGKDRNAGLRGASNFTNDTEFVFLLERTKDSYETVMTCFKQKDGEAFSPLSLKAKVVPLGLTMQNGKEATTLVMCEGGPIDAMSKKPVLNNETQELFNLLHEVICDGVNVPDTFQIYATTNDLNILSGKMILERDFKEKYYSYRISHLKKISESDSAKRSAYARCKKALTETSKLLFYMDYICLSEPLEAMPF